MIVQDGKVISIFFTLRLDRNDKLIAKRQEKPLEFMFGKKKFILGLDKILQGLQVGEKKKVKIAPENAYGLREEKRILSLKRSQISDNVEVHKGMVLTRKTKSGKQVKGVVKSFDTQNIVVDLNHPFAGETLRFETEIVDIRDANTDETVTASTNYKADIQ